MEIDKLTLAQLKDVAALFCEQAKSTQEGLNDFVGKKCIFRTYSDGVWYGTLAKKFGDEVIISGAIRLHQWQAYKSISLSAVAHYGVMPANCRFSNQIEQAWTRVIGILPCTEQAIRSIEMVGEAEQK